MQSKNSKAFVYFLLFLQAIVIAALFSPVRGFDFLNIDDDIYITKNPFVNSGLLWSNIHWAFTNYHGGHWHPLSWMSHMVDVEFFGLNPQGHHLTNVVFHILNATLLWCFLSRATGSIAASFFVSLIFGTHPMRIESVAWATERKDVLSVFFALLLLNSYVSFVRAELKASKILFYILCLLCFVCSLLSKPTIVPFPIILLLLDYWPLNRLSFEKGLPLRGIFLLCLEKIMFFAISLGSSVVTVKAQDAGGGLKSLSDYTLSGRVANALTSYLAYAGKLFFPINMGIFYPFQFYPPGVGAGSLLGLFAITLLCWLGRKKYPCLIIGWLWFLITALPMIGFIQFGGQAFADRWSYLPHIGLLMGLTWFVKAHFAEYRKILEFVVSPTCVGLCFAVTSLNLPFWRDSETLFRHTVEVSPDNFFAYTNLGAAVDEKGRLEEAREYFDRAVQLRPTYTIAVSNLAGVYARLGNLAAARNLYERTLSINSNFLPARQQLGYVKMQQGDVFGALVEWAAVLSADPSAGEVRNVLKAYASDIATRGCPGVAAPVVYQQLSSLRQLVGEADAKIPDQALRGVIDNLAGCYGLR